MGQSGLQVALQEALALHQQGRIAEAAAHYRKILASQPHNAEALHLLGVAELQSGNPGLAVTLIGRAIAVDPRNANYHTNLGLAQSNLGRLEEALASLDSALSINPHSANALNHRGNVLRSLGRSDDALLSYARALAGDPHHADALNNRGAVLADLNRTGEALGSFDRALAADSNHAGALSNRGALRVRLKRFDEGLADLNRAAALDGDNPVVLNNRGNALCGLKRYGDALADFARAVAIKPDYTDAWFNRGTAFFEMRRFGEAVADLDHALSLDPSRVDALILRGQALQKLNRAEEALQSYDRALEIKPGEAEALVSRAHLFSELGRLDRALADYNAAATIDPDHDLLAGWRAFAKLRMCDWRGIAGDLERVVEAVGRGENACSPAVMLALSDSPELLLQCAASHVRRYYPDVETAPFIRCFDSDRIRLGYFSADFHDHATAWLTSGVFENHDRERFEVTAFSFGPAKRDTMRTRLERAFDRFVDIGEASDAEAARLARENGIDIAIDMKSFTEGSRPGIFALRAAPIQVSWLGYPGTMGAGYIDYLIADRIVLPETAQDFYCEKPAWLPNCYQPNDSTRAIAAPAAIRRDAGLPDDAFVFCCFNNNYKITPDIFAIWMRLLTRVERSVLWLLEDNGFAAGNLRCEAQERGVSPERLIFAKRIGQPEHLARHRLADLFLDTLPYNAHTTASNALWAGLPVLTCTGAAFQGRVATSLLHAIGAPELIMEDLRAYEAAALQLASNPERLTAIREKTLANRHTHPLFDTVRYTRDLEAAFLRMREQYLSGRPAEAIRVQD